MSFQHEKYIIYYESLASDDFVYGSQINIEAKDKVTMQYHLIPSGSSIHSWSSARTFQSERTVPPLPILKKEHEYYVKANLSSVPEDRVDIYLYFYDRFDRLLNVKIMKTKFASFVYPKDAYSYKIELVNAGADQVEFNWLEIGEYYSEPLDDLVERYEIIVPEGIDQRDSINVLFTEPLANRQVPQLAADSRFNMDGTIIIASVTPISDIYMEQFLFEKLDRLLSEHQFETVNFIGYGPITNFAATIYGLRYDCSKIYITQTHGLKLFNDYSDQSPSSLRYSQLHNNMISNLLKKKTHYYGRYTSANYMLKTGSQVLDFTNKLLDLPLIGKASADEEVVI